MGKNVTFYVSEPDLAVLDQLHDAVLKGQSLGAWIMIKAREDIDKNVLKEPEKPKAVCQHSRMLREGKLCDWHDCPLLDRTYGQLAQKREFEAKEKCLFRLKEVNENAV